DREERRKQCEPGPRGAAAGGERAPLQRGLEPAALSNPHGQIGYRRREEWMSLFSALSVSASGMAAQRARAEVLVENLANSETTRTPEGGPYRRKDVVFESDAAHTSFASIYRTSLEPASQGVRVAGVIEDTTPPD